MKKVLSLLIVVLVLICTIALVSCDDDKKRTTTTTTTTTAPYCRHDDPIQIVVVNAVSPTCQETGLTEGKKCNLCGTMVVPQTIVETIECIESDWIVDEEASPTEGGKRHTECIYCGKMFKEETCGVTTGSIGLEFALCEDGETYLLSGIGSCADTDIIIPSKYNWLPVTQIGNRAFYGCATLTSVTIPESVISFDAYAFSYTSLENITISSSVIMIHYASLAYCSSLTNIYVDENNPKYKSIDGNLYAENGQVLIQYAIGKTETSFVIPDHVILIEGHAFSRSSLKNVVIPNSVREIDRAAFASCTSLEGITFEGTVDEWNAIYFGDNWNYNVPATAVVCSDGTVTLE